MTGIELRSVAFDDHAAIPRRHSGEGDDVSPPLTWSAAPDGTAELVLLCEDPDAPGGAFLHWLVTGIDPESSGAAEGEVPQGGQEWPNGFGRVGWAGPMPPPGHGVHRYFFRLWAVSEPLSLHGRPTADAVHHAVKGQELASGTLVGTYRR
ncbi:YbhB/YbcL family Raf kinase inhibitor-like protein [Streptomyces sp. GS7]|uniref:YbhB/YbcL family Raf kinase inhibitor-like protein n=1 Tax=Streptomyces sp. GS7 TaxID=2692234 RepID=UPI0013195777|nr:YbhB/YbcL family Raf kinase inhibitor-like protein [Streptomyces sp. GS7]QHC22231.1 YbhB/YbcL family Raf kinase inhibitor-like protein [Streptomyces sp. GS7]